MTSFLRFIIRHRWLILAMFLIITTLSIAVILQGVIASSVANLFLGEDPDYYRYRDLVAAFGSDEVAIIGYEDRQPLSKESLERLARVVRRIEAMPETAYVDSLLNAVRISGDGETIEISRYIDEILEGRADAADVEAELREDRLSSGLVISRHPGHAAVIVELKLDQDRPAEDTTRIVDCILTAFTSNGYPAERLHRGGYLAVLAEMMHQTYVSLTEILPLVAIVLMLAVFLLFRRFWPVIITMGIALVSVLWTMGFAVALDHNINILIAMAPAVILVVSFSDVIHLSSAYLLELEQGHPKQEAILRSGSDVGQACLFTSLTTFIGFISLSLVPTPVFRQMGMVLGFGVGVSLLIAMTLTPILFSLMRQPKSWRTGATSDWLDRFLESSTVVTLARPKAIIALFTAGLIIAAAGTARLRIETDFAERLSGRNQVRIDEDYFKDTFAGTTTLDVYLETDRDGGLLDPELFAAIDRFQTAVLDMKDVDSAMSLVDAVHIMHEELTGEPGLPAGGEALVQYLLLLEMSDDLSLDRMIDFERRSMRLALRLSVSGVRRIAAVADDVERLAAVMLDDHVHVEASGIICLIGRWLDRIVIGQRNGLLFAFLTIAVMMTIGLRSMRAGCWSMVPNVIPILGLGGYLGWCWHEADSDVIAIAMIAIGIGVDDTIHFLMRLRLETARTESIEDAVTNTFHFSGRAIVLTSVILVAGFSPFILSDYFSTRMMGTLLPFTLLMALAADLYLVPSLVKCGCIRFRTGRS
ncbi:MMPL family transporter [bacterium]|nr:MMPL family transporter [candidate division CSSED10-310 bacterium]